MLHLLDTTLETYMRGEVPLDDQIDIAYDAPDGEWSARITRPTVNLFVWDVRRNQTESQGGMDLVERDNERFHRPVPPRIDFRYLVTTWTSEVRDEHALLGAILIACLRQPLIPERYLAGALSESTPVPRIQVAKWDGAESSEFWSSMGGQLKASLDLIVTTTVDTGVLAEAGPPILSLGLASRAIGTASESDQTVDLVERARRAAAREGGRNGA